MGRCRQSNPCRRCGVALCLSTCEVRATWLGMILKPGKEVSGGYFAAFNRRMA